MRRRGLLRRAELRAVAGGVEDDQGAAGDLGVDELADLRGAMTSSRDSRISVGT